MDKDKPLHEVSDAELKAEIVQEARRAIAAIDADNQNGTLLPDDYQKYRHAAAYVLEFNQREDSDDWTFDELTEHERQAQILDEAGYGVFMPRGPSGEKLDLSNSRP